MMTTDSVQRRILITGGCGRIGVLVARRLMDRYAFTLLDRRPPPPDLTLPYRQANISEYTTICTHFQGVDTVLHLAAELNPSADWNTLFRDNIVGTHNVFRAALAAGCRRVVFASSLHAVLGHPVEVAIDSATPTRPLTVYGATKAWGEHLARMYSVQHNLSMICARIGWLTDCTETRFTPGHPQLRVIITPRDLVAMLAACIEAPESIRYGIFHGVSYYPGGQFDLCEAEQKIGFVPQDNVQVLAWRNYQGILRRIAGKMRRESAALLAR
jgi:nucleoside-diphosphate-sugar epimerase